MLNKKIAICSSAMLLTSALITSAVVATSTPVEQDGSYLNYSMVNVTDESGQEYGISNEESAEFADITVITDESTIEPAKSSLRKRCTDEELKLYLKEKNNWTDEEVSTFLEEKKSRFNEIKNKGVFSEKGTASKPIRVEKLYEVDGESLSLKALCEKYNQDIFIVKYRLRKGQDISDAIKTPASEEELNMIKNKKDNFNALKNNRAKLNSKGNQ